METKDDAHPRGRLPICGHDDQIRTRAFSIQVDPAGVSVPISDGEAIVRGEKREINILVAREEVTVTDARYAPGERVAEPHVHHEHTDAFYVLEGELTFELGREAERITGGVSKL
jgi:quercetin dioxygenase-like cupin family protein